jgi:endoglucanase
MRIPKYSWLLGSLTMAVLTSQAHAATCSYKVENEWNTGFTGSITIANTTTATINDWAVNWAYSKNKITSSWSATFTGSNPYTAVPLSWNKTIQPGQSVSIGFQGDKNGGVAEAPKVNGAVCGTNASSTPSSISSSSKSSVKSSSSSSSIVSSKSSSSKSSSSISSSSKSSVSSSSAGSVISNASNDDWLHTDGSKILDKNGKAVWLTGANWFGFNAGERVFHGLWSVNMDVTLKSISARGINILRVPISVQLLKEWQNGQAATVSINNYANPELAGKTSLEIFDAFLAQSRKYGLKVLLDVHSAEADNSGHIVPLWYKGAFTTADFYAGWEWVAKRYKDDDTIVAFDLKNEPHGQPSGNEAFAKWDSSTDPTNWKYTAEETAKRILAINPNVLILIEGIEAFPIDGKTWTSKVKTDYYSNWWGGNLRGVASLPVKVTGHQQQIMYSPHDYGPLVFAQPWFYSGFSKETLYKDVWHDNWLYIHEQRISPLLIGEWGGFMDGGANEVWMKAMRDLIIQYKLHHTFWCINPNSGDTGGLLMNDWTTWDEAKYAMMKPSLWKAANGKFIGLDHKVPLGGAGVGLSVTDFYLSGGVEPVGL